MSWYERITVDRTPVVGDLVLTEVDSRPRVGELIARHQQLNLVCLDSGPSVVKTDKQIRHIWRTWQSEAGIK